MEQKMFLQARGISKNAEMLKTIIVVEGREDCDGDIAIWTAI